MNAFTFDQLEVGHEERFERTVTAEMMDQFYAVSGDSNPLHCDEGYAMAQGFPGRVVYGMLTSSLYSALAGVYLPGKFCLLHSVDSKFRKPVFIGDTLTVRGTLTEKNETFHLLTIKASIVNQNGEKVSSAVISAGFLQRIATLD